MFLASASGLLHHGAETHSYLLVQSGTSAASTSQAPASDLDNEAYMKDDFRMLEFKARPWACGTFHSVGAVGCLTLLPPPPQVRRCTKTRAHDWTECPFTHPGEKARRRDPRRFNYCGTACPDFRKGACRRGDACEYAHGARGGAARPRAPGRAPPAS